MFGVADSRRRAGRTPRSKKLFSTRTSGILRNSQQARALDAREWMIHCRSDLIRILAVGVMDMKVLDKLCHPDFLVRWRGVSTRFDEAVFCEPPQRAPADPSRTSTALANAEHGAAGAGDLRRPIATLQTPSSYVEVSEVSFCEPTELVLAPNRIGFTMVLSHCRTAIEFGYVGDDARYFSRPGQVLLFPRGREVCGRTAAGTMRTVTCSFDPAYSEDVVGSLAGLSHSQWFSCLDLRSSLSSAILWRLANEAVRPGFLSTALVESLGQAMLIEGVQRLQLRERKPQVRGRLTARHFNTIDEYLAELSGKPPSIAAAAAACGMSASHLARLFRVQTQQSIGRYFKSVQLAKAQAYLLETDVPLKEIAYRLGFSSPSNFAAAFRAATGFSPGEFRRRGPAAERED